MGTRKINRNPQKSKKGFRKTRSKKYFSKKYHKKGGKGVTHQRGGNKDDDLLTAIKYCDLGEAERLLDEDGINVNVTDWLGNTPLHMASYNGHAEIAATLLEKGADVNAIDGLYENTALIFASDLGNTETVKILLENGSDVNVNAKNKKNMTALQLANQKGHTKIVELLIRKDATITGGIDYQELRDTKREIFQRKKDGVLVASHKGVPEGPANLVGKFLGGKRKSNRKKVVKQKKSRNMKGG